MDARMIFFDTLRQGLWVAVAISIPILAVALSRAGVGLFQALTSIQEMTLTFVPKLAAIARRLLGVDELHDTDLTTYFTGPPDPADGGM